MHHLFERGAHRARRCRPAACPRRATKEMICGWVRHGYIISFAAAPRRRPRLLRPTPVRNPDLFSSFGAARIIASPLPLLSSHPLLLVSVLSSHLAFLGISAPHSSRPSRKLSRVSQPMAAVVSMVSRVSRPMAALVSQPMVAGAGLGGTDRPQGRQGAASQPQQL